MLALAKQLTATGRVAAVMVSAELGAPFSEDTGKAELAILCAGKAMCGGNCDGYVNGNRCGADASGEGDFDSA
jgi:hypothetical protein